MKIYRVNSSMINEDYFKERIISALDIYKFATIEQLSFVLKARKDDIQEVLESIIIWYVKENENASYKQVCIDLNVKSDYIEKLVEEGRLEEKGPIPDEVKQVENAMAKATSEAISDIRRREAIMQLNKNIDFSNRKDTPKFHTLERLSTKKK